MRHCAEKLLTTRQAEPSLVVRLAALRPGPDGMCSQGGAPIRHRFDE